MKKIFQIENNGKRLRVKFLGLKILSLKVYSQTKKKLNQSKVKKGKIVFINFTDKGYGCSPKYIADYLLKNNYKYNLVWLVKDPSSQKEEFPDSIKLVKFDTRDALDELATAQFWISNCRLISFLSRGLEKKSNQTYIQTWHGFLGIKKVESDVAGSLSEGYIKYSRQDSSYIDFFICK